MLPEDLNAQAEAALADAGRRTFPLPRIPWIVSMRWERVLFLSWRVDQDTLRALVPPELEVDTFDGDAFVSVLPFHMAHMHLRDVPPVPDLTAFGEINFRTYVSYRGRPGVWFLSLDAPSHLFDWLARHVFHLPYFFADMSFRADGAASALTSTRTSSDVRLDVGYEPSGAAAPPAEGSLEAFLCDRDAVFALDHHGEMHRGDLHHPAWQLRPVRFELRRCDHLTWAGLSAPNEEPVAIYSDFTDTVMWPPVRA